MIKCNNCGCTLDTPAALQNGENVLCVKCQNKLHAQNRMDNFISALFEMDAALKAAGFINPTRHLSFNVSTDLLHALYSHCRIPDAIHTPLCGTIHGYNIHRKLFAAGNAD